MPTSTFWGCTWCLIGLKRFIDTEPCHSILLRDLHKHIKWTSRTVGTRPITISSTCHKWSHFSIVFSRSISVSFISQHLLRVGRTVPPPAQSTLPALIWQPPWASSHNQSPNSWDPKTTAIESILTQRGKNSDHYSTICRTQCTAWHDIMARVSLLIVRVIITRIYRMNNCTQWSSVFTMVWTFKLWILKVNTYLRLVVTQEGRAGVVETDGMTQWGYSITRGDVMACWMVVSQGNCNDYSKSSCWMRMELSLRTG